jgi:large subunit ribosomal protein L30
MNCWASQRRLPAGEEVAVVAGKLRITWKRSAIGSPQDQKDTIEALGLRRLNSSVEKDDNASVRGMVYKVRHLVEVEEISG